jgi:hypothetical protein
MYVFKDGESRHVYDWISPVRCIDQIRCAAKHNRYFCFVFVQNEDHIDMWQCNKAKDFRYDLVRYYKHVYGMDFASMNYVVFDFKQIFKPVPMVSDILQKGGEVNEKALQVN